MNRREFISKIPGTLKQAYCHLIPDSLPLGWFGRVMNANRNGISAAEKMIVLDASLCSACGEATCCCKRIT